MGRRRVMLVGVFGALLLAGVAALDDELRAFVLLQVAPARAREVFLRRLVPGAGPPLYVLGTIHGAHFETPEYGLAHLEAVLRHLRPGRLLVESRPEQLATGLIGDGPVEMAAAHLNARALGIPVDGVDWYDEGQSSLRRTDAVRDDHIAARVLERRDPQATTLVLVGYSHVPELVARLSARGFREDAPSAAEKAALFDTSEVLPGYPTGFAAAIEARIARDEAARARATPERAERLGEAIAARREILTRIRAVGERTPGPAPSE